LNDIAGNVVISPVSVSTLLAIVQQGAGGSTESQLTEVLHLGPEQSRDGYSHLTRNLKVTCPAYSHNLATICLIHTGGHAVGHLIETLCYKPEGAIPDEDTGFFDLPNLSRHTVALG
jgi:hypothetical protein